MLLGAAPKTRITSATALFLTACAFGAAGMAPMPDPADLPVRSVVEDLALPTLPEQVAAMEKQHYFREEEVRSGDTLGALLLRLGVDDAQAAAFLKSDPLARNVLRLKPGKTVHAELGADGTLQTLTMPDADAGRQDDAPKNIVVRRDGDGMRAAEVPASLERRVEMRSGEIRSSLFAATDDARIPDNVANQIVQMFATDIDFASDLRRGDRFNVVYESFWQDGEPVRAGRVLAAEFLNDGKAYQAVWFDSPDDARGGGYYGFDGHSLKKAFLRSPLTFSRISSGFSMRLHPILGKWKAHKGVDFAAATGTPIHASGDGTVEFIGRQTGYGNVVMLKHWSDYSTVYAHMSRFAEGLHKGDKVQQGEVIGYVGATGWATGPHLHYEFRVDNVPRDPLTVDIPNAQPLAGADLQRFASVSSEMQRRIALLDASAGGTRLASR